MYRDRPRPSGSYVVINGGFLAGLAVLHVAFIVAFACPLWCDIAVSTGVSLIYLYTLLVLHASFYTDYTIDNELVTLRAGVLVRRCIDRDSIRRVDPTVSLDRVIGWGPNSEGYCNRFTDGVRIIAGEKSIFCSPTDCSAFIEALKREAVTSRIP